MCLTHAHIEHQGSGVSVRSYKVVCFKEGVFKSPFMEEPYLVGQKKRAHGPEVISFDDYSPLDAPLDPEAESYGVVWCRPRGFNVGGGFIHTFATVEDAARFVLHNTMSCSSEKNYWAILECTTKGPYYSGLFDSDFRAIASRSVKVKRALSAQEVMACCPCWSVSDISCFSEAYIQW